tara:strand:+ start:400 stop:1557 length:1158 start_codon:yes stop_codon:yes gene_type:complete
MKILYIHSYKLDDKMANCVQVISMCKSFSKQAKVFLLTPKSDKTELEMKNYLKSSFDFPDDINLLFFKSQIFGKRISNLINYFSVKKFTDNVKPDFCFVRNTSFLASLLFLKIPTFYEVHNSVLHYRFFLLNLFLVNRLVKISKNKNLVSIITISKQLANFWISKGIPKSKILELHDGFDNNVFETKINKHKARKLVNILPNKKVAIYTGSLYEDRKIHNIIYLARDFENVDFIVIGGPENQKEYYQKKSYDLKISNILFKGHIPHNEISLYLFSADFLLALWSDDVPTINYCSPLKVFEYMASGSLIIAHAYPPIKEVLKDNINAYLVKPDKYEELKIVFKKAIENNSNNNIIISERARKDAFIKYSWDVRTDKIINSFKKYKF